MSTTRNMALEERDIREAITRGAKKGAISHAVLQQGRIKFHAQTEVTPLYTQAASDFLSFVSNLLPKDKFHVFRTLLRVPVKTNELVAVAFDKLSRVFEGRNPVFNYQFSDTEARDDWEEYRRDRLREPQVWRTTGWEHFKTEINSVLVVDVPESQAGALPEPYFYWLPIDRVVTYEADPQTGAMSWLIFKLDGERLAVIDDGSYRVFASRDGNIGRLLRESPHDLGYCPARFFWTEPLSLSEPDVKMSPLSRELDSLDWYLFYHISKRYLDMYGSYPIYSGYEKACDYSDPETGDWCDGGFLRDKRGTYLFDRYGAMVQCPKCGSRRINGPGSFVEIPVPGKDEGGNETPDMRNPVQMLTVDRDSLDYNVDEERRLRTEIITSVVGQPEEVTQREALNEQQVRAGFESQSTVLNRVKKGFEDAQRFVDETVCRLRYGGVFLTSEVNYGTEFFLYDPAELRERYRKARESGSSEAELDALYRQIIDTEYRNNPAERRRMMLLGEIEPFPHLTRGEVSALYDKGVVDAPTMLLKMDFAGYLRRFERENMNVMLFGSETDYARKVSAIREAMLSYAREDAGSVIQTNN